MTRLSNRGSALIILGVFAAVLAWQALLVARWTAAETRPPSWDPAVHLATSLDYAEAWREGRWLDSLRTIPRPGHPSYPPFYDYSATLALRAARPHVAVAWLNLAYWALSLLAAGWLAWRLGGAWACAGAIALAGLSAESLWIYRQAFPDIALALWLPATYAALLESRLFEDRRWSAVAGVCAGLAMNSKWAAALFLLPAIACGAPRRRRRNAALAAGICLAMMAPWYLLNAPLTAARIWDSVTLGNRQGHPALWTARNWLYYPRFAGLCFGSCCAALLAAGAGWATWRAPRPVLEARRCVAAWLVLAYLVCTLVPSKDNRYFLPSLGALPALAASALPPPALAVPVALALWNQRRVVSPRTEDWRNDEILAEAARLSGGGPATVCVLPNHESLNTTSLIFQARRAGLRNLSFGCQLSDIPEWANLVVAKTGDPGAFLSDQSLAVAAAARDPRSLFSRVFVERSRWALPDGSQAVLYAQRPDLPRPRKTLRWAALKVRSASLEGVTLAPAGGSDYDLTATTLRLEKLDAPIRNVWVRLTDARLYESGGALYVLGVKRVALKRARLAWADASEALSRRARLPISIEKKDAAISIAARCGPLAARAVVELSVEPDMIAGRVSSLRLAGVPVPGIGAASWRRELAPAPPYQPYELRVERVVASDKTLRIEPRGLAMEDDGGHGTRD